MGQNAQIITGKGLIVIVLKHLARAYDLSPYRLREKLRQKFGKHPKGRWKWPSAEDPDYKKVIEFLDENRKKGVKHGEKKSKAEEVKDPE